MEFNHRVSQGIVGWGVVVVVGGSDGGSDGGSGGAGVCLLCLDL